MHIIKNSTLALILAGGVFCAGCSEQDATKISKVGNKALDKARGLTSHAGDRIGLSIRGAKAAIGGMEIAGRVETRLKGDIYLQSLPIKVSSDKGAITLSGSVNEDAERQRAIELARTTVGVEQVTDALQVAAASASPPGK